MRRLLLITLSLSIVSSLFCSAQSCKVDVITLTSKVKANPGSVLYALGDAMALNPSCIGDLLEAAITAADPDEDTLTQMIRLAVSEYPAKSGEIAEAAVLASPDDVAVIRQAFIPEKKPIIATPVFETGGTLAPIENFLSSYRDEPRGDTGEESPLPESVPVELPGSDASVEVFGAKPQNPDDAAFKAMQAIDNLLEKLQTGENGTSGGLTSNAGLEKFRLNTPDREIGITTINDPEYHDEKNEELEEQDPEPLVFQDPVREVIPVHYISENPEKTPVAKKVEFTSSVYPIPSSKSGEFGPPVLRSAPVSPTTPRGR